MRIDELINKNVFEDSDLGLTIFDIDDTLFRTTAQIKVVKDGKIIRSLNNQEFNTYQLQPGERFDFGEFQNAEKFNRESIPIEPMLAKLKAILRNAGDSTVIMLTARSDFDDKELFLDTFRKYGIDMSKVHVHRAGNLGGSPSQNKAVWIRKYLDTGKYARVRLYDDAMSNIKMFIELQSEYPDIKFFPYFVTHEGTIKTIREDGRIVKGVNTTVDVGPNEIKKQAAKFGNKVDRDGRPPSMSSAVKGKSTNVLFNLGLAESIEPKTRKNYNDFVEYCCEYLELEQRPRIRLTDEIFDDTFGYFNSEDDSITVSYNRRHQMDVMRTIAHELTHYRQRLDGEDLDGRDGSDHENEANAFAGVLLRQWASKHPNLFSEQKFTDYELALIEGGHSLDDNNFKKLKQPGKLFKALSEYEIEDMHPNERPPGPEFKPTMPAGSIRVKVSDVYDWYKLGQHISDLGNLDQNDFGEGPPEAVIAFGSEEEEHKYIKLLQKLGLEILDVDPGAADAPGVGTDPTYNTTENFADGKVKGKSRPGRVKKSGASCKGSVTDLRARAKKYSGERGRMYHWCANMKSGRKKS
jgi:hypothetical protein